MGGDTFPQSQISGEEYIYPSQEQTAYIEIDPEPEEILDILTNYWWVGAIFIVGVITVGIAGLRIVKKNAWVKELLDMWKAK